VSLKKSERGCRSRKKRGSGNEREIEKKSGAAGTQRKHDYLKKKNSIEVENVRLTANQNDLLWKGHIRTLNIQGPFGKRARRRVVERPGSPLRERGKG